MQRRLWPQQRRRSKLENNQVTLSKLGGKVSPYQEFHTLTQGLALSDMQGFKVSLPPVHAQKPSKTKSSKRREKSRNEKTSDPQRGDPAREGGRGTRGKMGRGGPRRRPCSVPPEQERRRQETFPRTRREGVGIAGSVQG